MSRRFLLDSNAIIDHIGGVRRLPDAVAKSEAMLVSQIAVAEVKAGFDDTRRGRRDRDALSVFLGLSNVVEITITSATTDLYAKVFRALRAAGTPIPVNDIWLAAQALEHGAVVVSTDRHFKAVANLRTLFPDD